MDRSIGMDKRAEREIKLLTYILNALCTRELSNEGRHFLQNEIKKRGGNYKG